MSAYIRAGSARRSLAKRRALCGDELRDPVEGEREDAVEVTSREGPALGGPLDLDELALAGRDHVDVGVGDRVFRVREVEEEVALHVARGHRGDVAHDRRRLDLADGVGERDKAAGDGGGSRSPIGLYDLAVDHHAPRPERLQVDRRAKRSADEALDLEGAPAGASRDAFALAPLRRAPREHRVLSGDPAGALAFEE